MSCAPPPTFRLLDGFVGWDVATAQALAGMGEGEALELAIVGGGANPQQLIAYLPPPPLARGCGPCQWYLVTPDGRLLQRNSCGGFLPVRGSPGEKGDLVRPVAVAARRHRVAVADPGAGRVRVWSASGAQDVASIAVAAPKLVALTPWNEILVVAEGGSRVLRFGPSGTPREPLPAPLPPLLPGGAWDRLGAGSDCAVWLTSTEPATAFDGSVTTAYRLWRAERDGAAFVPATQAQLAAAFSPTGITAASPAGFCLGESGPDGAVVERCYAWDGSELPEGAVSPIPPPQRERRGQLMTLAIDSGIARCRWHRVRVDADVPFATALEVAVASSEDRAPVPQGVSFSPWTMFVPGTPHPDDWQASVARDFLVDQPPGRYLFVRVRLSGDSLATPRVRRLTLVMPRVTSLERLPPVYREDAEAEDFSERFLSLFDATISDLDRAIERAPALLDADGVPDAALPWLARFLDIVLDASWTSAQRRALLDAAPALYRARGTVGGLMQVIALLHGVTPFIDELSQGRLWGAVGRTSVLGGTRLFGPARARLLVGGSRLGSAPVQSFGATAQDPFAQLAFRFRLLAPPSPSLASKKGRARLRRLVESQKPAHTEATVRVGGDGFIVGVWSNVGIDSAFGSLPPPVLGQNARLSRMTVLWPGPGGRAAGIGVGTTARVGVGTVVQG